MSYPATYRSGTPRIQHPAVARWHAHLHGLATPIHETSGLAIYFATVCGNFAHVLLDLFDIGALKAGVLEKLGKS